jgi:hypothetical protein
MGAGFTERFSGTVTQGWLFNAGGTGSLAGQQGVIFSFLVDAINSLTAVAKSKIAIIRSKKSAMSIADMFDLQMAMNRLSQFSEMSTSVISAMNTSMNSMARNMK